MPALHALFCLRLWVFGLVFVRYKALEIRVLCFFVGNIFGDKEKLRQMILQFLQNAGDEGAKRDSIYEYLRDVLPSNKTDEQQLRMVGKLLVEMDENKLITTKGRKWIIRS